jgi:hypothetical protein
MTDKEIIIFTTAYKNINRDKWLFYNRTSETYFQGFYNLSKTIKYKLVVYLENELKQEITRNNSIIFNENIFFINMTEVDTFYNKYLLLDKKIMESETYKQKIPPYRRTNPEHIYSEYNLITHSKINFVSHTQRIFPNYAHYAWIDFDTINRNIQNIPQHIQSNLLVPKIMFSCLAPLPTTRPEANAMLASDIVYFDGSMFIINADLVKNFENAYEKKIIEWQSINITDDDQNIVLQLFYDNPNAFHITYNINDWFALYRSLQTK